MGTLSAYSIVAEDDIILQGDIFKNITYIYKTEENENYVDVTELTFPYGIIVSQACDVKAMNELTISNDINITKFMPSILIVPIYDKDVYKTGAFVDNVYDNIYTSMKRGVMYTSDEFKIINNDYHYRFHYLKLKKEEKENNIIFPEEAIIDFKHYFSLCPEYLMNIRKNRICRLEPLYSEQITLRFTTYLSRVAIPD